MLRASQERRLGGAASVLARARVAVRCQTVGGACVDAGPELGYVRWRADGSPGPWTLIKRDQCRHLAAYLRSDKRRPPATRWWPCTSSRAAVQRDAHTARLLGAGAYWRDIYPLTPGGYRSGDCRPGGPLDEGLVDAPWFASVSS